MNVTQKIREPDARQNDHAALNRATIAQNAAMLANACAMLLSETRGTADCYHLAGPHNARKRVAIMATLLGVAKVPQAKAGVNALRDEFWQRCGVTGDCIAHKDDRLATLAREFAENATIPAYREWKRGYDAACAARDPRRFTPYGRRVIELEAQGMTTSDAQGIADVEGLDDFAGGES